jgi:DNA invertase Pin-like site-specific DNA recombinase
MSDKIQPSHLERRAVVYLRQSDPRQVHQHPESTARQYALQRRAAELGWPRDRIEVIDEDLGQSGASTEWRQGFKRLAEDVAHGRVGAIFALEVSRLARCSADWYRLLDLCGLADVILIDEQSVYTPRNSDDRLLLGLKGAMSEAEQTWMRLRLHGGRLNKARRGELHFNACVGYEWDDAQHRFRLDPDEHVQRAVRLIFERFRLDGSVYAVVRYFMRHRLQMPSRDMGNHDVHWEAPRYGVANRMLHNPMYAGAYAFGRRERRMALVDGRVRRCTSNRPQQAWLVCLHDRHPAYITWEEFMANQHKLHDNIPPKNPDQHGATREGHALLQGLVLCGKCGRKMCVRYYGRFARARYECRSQLLYSHRRLFCWIVAGRHIDDAVAKLFLNTVQTSEIELGLAVVREAERQSAEVDRQWKLRLDRARYEARLAERRYKAVDPDNRVVARTLEHEWNEKLREVDELERSHQEARQHAKLEISASDHARILALAKDLPRVWRAETTTHLERKNLLRMLVQQVTLSPVDVPQRTTRIQVLWRTGAVTDFTIPRPAHTKTCTTTEDALVLIRALDDEHRTNAAIAAELNARGFHNVRNGPWNAGAVQAARKIHGPPSRARSLQLRRPDQRRDGLYSIHGVAAHLAVTETTVRHWIKQGWLRPTVGYRRGVASWFKLDAATVRRLRTIKATHGGGAL